MTAFKNSRARTALVSFAVAALLAVTAATAQIAVGVTVADPVIVTSDAALLACGELHSASERSNCTRTIRKLI